METPERVFSFTLTTPLVLRFSITLLLVSYFNKSTESDGVVPAVLVDVVVQDGWVWGDSRRHDGSFSSTHHHVFTNKLQHCQVLSEFTATKVDKIFWMFLYNAPILVILSSDFKALGGSFSVCMLPCLSAMIFRSTFGCYTCFTQQWRFNTKTTSMKIKHQIRNTFLNLKDKLKLTKGILLFYTRIVHVWQVWKLYRISVEFLSFVTFQHFC